MFASLPVGCCVYRPSPLGSCCSLVGPDTLLDWGTHCHHRSSQSGKTLAGSLERRCSNICSRVVSGLASRNSDRRPSFIIQSLRASGGSAISAGGGAELSAEVSADAMMPLYLADACCLSAATVTAFPSCPVSASARRVSVSAADIA